MTYACIPININELRQRATKFIRVEEMREYKIKSAPLPYMQKRRERIMTGLRKTTIG